MDRPLLWVCTLFSMLPFSGRLHFALLLFGLARVFDGTTTFCEGTYPRYLRHFVSGQSFFVSRSRLAFVVVVEFDMSVRFVCVT